MLATPLQLASTPPRHRARCTHLQTQPGRIQPIDSSQLAGHWRVRGGLGVQSASIVRDNNGQAGKRVRNVARLNGSLFLSYRPPQGWYGETGVTFVGARYADNANAVRLPDYGRLDAMLGYRTGAWDWRLAVRNLADKTYFASATSAGQIRYGEPRVALATLQYVF
ncbi:TonB-dependent receptor domain-containing protein [Bordetella pertussis]|uniref:TonB-dependent receptor domain-containing protein n=16 Tax=Bordetella pertussis TaxID=520 RepID=UPI000983876E|nr:TonB-dependent receptor [Bordetella pertussis]ASR64286.1 TonB-dependent receptor [Bordetella pertussis]ASR67654.1 TonB-dependent receptor [Bordetella pertussis]UEA96177.1 TonB-dependent receptor [Bordetella pertussis]